MRINGRNWRISGNAPVILLFTALSFGALLFNGITGGWANQALFSVYRSSLLDPFTYIRFFGHVLGHANWSHFIGNIMLLLVIGPLLEEKYGSAELLVVILTTALVTGAAHFLFAPGSRLLGASGVVFACILLASLGSLREGEIPLTFLLVAAIYLGQQLYGALFLKDGVSYLTHILGGVTGASFGYLMNRNRVRI